MRQVDGVLLDKPAQARYDESGESAMIFSVEWWVESVADERPVVDRVNTALQGALRAAGIEAPYPTHNLNLNVEPETVDRISKAWGEYRRTFTRQTR